MLDDNLLHRNGKTMDDVLDDLNRRFQELVEKGREFVEDEEFQQKLDQYKKKAGDTIKKYPIGSIAAGLLAGYLLARWISNNDE